MPTSINGLLTSAEINASRLKIVKWKQPFDCSSIGIYFVSTTDNIFENNNLYDDAPIDEDILSFWINKVKTIQIDKKLALSNIALKDRLNKFWLPDENILYIGKADCVGGLKKRIRQYYNTEIGERKPHAGGHWIKTLNILNELFVHYLPVQNPLQLEEKLLHLFREQVSKETLKILGDSQLAIPFANLEIGKSHRKKHGIGKCKLSTNCYQKNNPDAT